MLLGTSVSQPPRLDAHALRRPPDHQPIAVVLDLVPPDRAAGRDRHRRRAARLAEAERIRGHGAVRSGSDLGVNGAELRRQTKEAPHGLADRAGLRIENALTVRE